MTSPRTMIIDALLIEATALRAAGARAPDLVRVHL
jgi:hypothetical protein